MCMTLNRNYKATSVISKQFELIEMSNKKIYNNKIYAFPRHCLPWYHENAYIVINKPVADRISWSPQVQHQYVLTDEQGPAHKKVFFVKLLLGDTEEYFASGPSIKKAQHIAAAQALEKTQFKHPPPKQPKTSITASE